LARESGFWSEPCRVCAAAFDAEKELRLRELKETPEWATSPAWPYVNTDIEAEKLAIKAAIAEEDERWADFDEFFGEED
jgi:hypothetical protein